MSPLNRISGDHPAYRPVKVNHRSAASPDELVAKIAGEIGADFLRAFFKALHVAGEMNQRYKRPAIRPARLDSRYLGINEPGIPGVAEQAADPGARERELIGADQQRLYRGEPSEGGGNPLDDARL